MKGRNRMIPTTYTEMVPRLLEDQLSLQSGTNEKL